MWGHQLRRLPPCLGSKTRRKPLKSSAYFAEIPSSSRHGSCSPGLVAVSENTVGREGVGGGKSKSHSCFFFLLPGSVAGRDGEFGVFKPPASLQDASSSPSDQPFPSLCKCGLLCNKAKRGHLFQAGTKCKLPSETERQPAWHGGESRGQQPPPPPGCGTQRNRAHGCAWGDYSY